MSRPRSRRSPSLPRITRSATSAALLASLLGLACNSPSAESPAEPESASATSAALEIADEGTRFEPPRTAAEIPSGAFVCNMGGSVHFASYHAGECPVCGMALTQLP
ncbi:MAG: hypothetical protein R3B40_03065 [Polyangiales bacterium]|nr:hypothetical protein [Myxococcales bacterium]